MVQKVAMEQPETFNENKQSFGILLKCHNGLSICMKLTWIVGPKS